MAHLAENTQTDTKGEVKFSMTIGSVTLSEKAKAGDALLSACSQVTEVGAPVHIGKYRGFEIWLKFDSFSREFQAEMRNRLSHGVTLGNDVFGNIQRLDNQLESLSDRHGRCMEQLRTIEQQCENAKAELEKPFEFETELKEKGSRLAEIDSLLNMDTKTETEFLEVGQEVEESEDEPLQVRSPALCMER